MLTTFSGTVGGQVRQVLLYLEKRAGSYIGKMPNLKK